MNYTENYQLPQWEESDRVLRKDFNDAMDKVDQGMGDMPHFISGSYIGTGTYGPNGACELHFGFAPKMVILNTQEMTCSNDIGKYYFLFPGMTWFPAPYSNDTNHLTWLEDGISWYFEYQYDEPDEQAAKQYNTQNKDYKYIAATW